MSELALNRLAKAAGLAINWVDAHGKTKTVAPEVLRAVLAALGLPAGDDKAAHDSLKHLKQEGKSPPPLQVARAGQSLRLKSTAAMVRLTSDQTVQDCPVEDGAIRLPRAPGYYRLDDGLTVAVAPSRAWLPDYPVWGIGVQVYALRGSRGFGDFAALAGFCEQAGAIGADAVAVSPVHALFGARPRHISPYAPSTRLWLNPLYAQGESRDEEDGNLVDWPKASAAKWRQLRRQFRSFQQAGRTDCFQRFVAQGGERLLAHARFEVLDARFKKQGLGSWRDWPARYRNPAQIQDLASNDAEIAFQLFLQWKTDKDLAAAQARARAAGMAVGLIADMAVGMDPAGSHAWSAPAEVLQGLTIGAPPDILNPKGQNWGLTNFSPLGLARTGYDGFLAMLRAAMRHAGGVRLDHALGLKRLWVIPEGAGPADGVYLQYPLKPLLGLLALESRRHQSLVVAEDLGTVPDGFRGELARRNMLGMRVLWFERDAHGRFTPPGEWDRKAAALSTTHDLPTLAGWWTGTDIAWREKLGDPPKQVARQRRVRAADRAKLWRTLKKANCATGDRPHTAGFCDAALRDIAATPCPLKLVALEDFMGERQQPNIPGTIDEHPNWRRRLRTATPLASAVARRRAQILSGDT